MTLQILFRYDCILAASAERCGAISDSAVLPGPHWGVPRVSCTAWGPHTWSDQEGGGGADGPFLTLGWEDGTSRSITVSGREEGGTCPNSTNVVPEQGRGGSVAVGWYSLWHYWVTARSVAALDSTYIFPPLGNKCRSLHLRSTHLSQKVAFNTFSNDRCGLSSRAAPVCREPCNKGSVFNSKPMRRSVWRRQLSPLESLMSFLRVMTPSQPGPARPCDSTHPACAASW